MQNYQKGFGLLILIIIITLVIIGGGAYYIRDHQFSGISTNIITSDDVEGINKNILSSDGGEAIKTGSVKNIKMSRQEVRTLLSDKALEIEKTTTISKIAITSTNELRKLESFPVVIITREPSYVLIATGSRGSKLIKDAGFITTTPQETDYKNRQVTIVVKSKEQVAHIRDLGADVWPSGTDYPTTIIARLLDYQLEWLKEDGYTVTLLNQKP